MEDTESVVRIQDGEGEETVTVVESADDNTVVGIVGLNPDGSSIG